MNISKHIQILVLVLFPAWLMGMDQGSWIEQDKLGHNVLIEWRKITDYRDLLRAERELVPVMAAAFQHEKKVAETVEENTALVTKYLLQKNEEALSRYIQSKKVKNHICFVVTVKDVDSDKVLGFTIFRSKPKFDEPTCVQLEPLAVDPIAQCRGLSRILAFSIFKIDPMFNHIFLFVRRENTKAQGVYKTFGFIHFSENKVGFFLEYKKH